MLRIKNGGSSASVGELVSAIKKLGILEHEQETDLKENLEKLQKSKERFGEVDIKLEASKVDYVVYGLGTEDSLRTRSDKGELLRGGLLDESVLEGELNLSPLIDGENLFLSDPARRPFWAGKTRAARFRSSGSPPKTTKS